MFRTVSIIPSAIQLERKLVKKGLDSALVDSGLFNSRGSWGGGMLVLYLFVLWKLDSHIVSSCFERHPIPRADLVWVRPRMQTPAAHAVVPPLLHISPLLLPLLQLCSQTISKQSYCISFEEDMGELHLPLSLLICSQSWDTQPCFLLLGWKTASVFSRTACWGKPCRGASCCWVFAHLCCYPCIVLPYRLGCC